MKATIYAFIVSRWGTYYGVVALGKIDGAWKEVGGHMSSTVDWAKRDIGATGNSKHEAYAARFPDGFEVVWLDDPKTNAEIGHLFEDKPEVSDAALMAQTGEAGG